ncbi:hypothetical protein ABW20_dc0101087 [Dactylellina cionopaga]|nr:hypothetical protein ABW20_dc0101087 [Dactylellina cionopaga]
MVLPKYFLVKELAILRLIAISIIITWSGLLFANQDTINGFPFDFPTAIPERLPSASEPQSLAFLLPAACYQSEDTTLQRKIAATFKTADTFYTGISKNYYGYSQWIILTFLYIIALAVNILQHFLYKKNTKRRRYGKKVIWLFKFAAIVTGLAVCATSYRYIWLLHGWLDRSQWWKAVDGKNPENTWFTFGQLVPMLLLGLIPGILLESWADYRRNKAAAAAAAAAAVTHGKHSQVYYPPMPIPAPAPPAHTRHHT